MRKEVEELIRKYNIDLVALKSEQKKLSHLVKLKDIISIEDVRIIAGCDVITSGNKIICAIVLCDQELNVLEQKYSIKKATFPYISSFMSYRYLPLILETFKKLSEKPDIILIKAHGILHPRNFGLASHLGVALNLPTIGIASKLLVGEIKNHDVLIKDKIKGKVLETRKGSKPIFISPGHLITLNNAVKIVKKFVREPHKLPEPLHLAHKYAIKMRDELLK